MEPLADFSAAVTHERNISPSIGGRTVFDDALRSKKKVQDKQLSLFEK